MNDTQFFAMLSRMKYIDRWALMRNTADENLSQHSFEVAVLCHALAVINNERCLKADKSNYINPEHAAVLGLFHDCAEILTGDMPTPVKYYSQDIRGAYAEVEQQATDKLLHMLPEDMRGDYEPVLNYEKKEPEMKKLVKAADKLSALIKCIEEEKAGNKEFEKAKETTTYAIHKLEFEPAEIFLQDFLDNYRLTLDQLS